MNSSLIRIRGCLWINRDLKKIESGHEMEPNSVQNTGFVLRGIPYVDSPSYTSSVYRNSICY